MGQIDVQYSGGRENGGYGVESEEGSISIEVLDMVMSRPECVSQLIRSIMHGLMIGVHSMNVKFIVLL